MKKFKWVIGLLVLLWAFTAMAGTQEPLNVTINSSTWTAVTLSSPKPLAGYAFQTRDGADFLWKHASTDTAYFTVRDGNIIFVELSNSQQQEVLFYAKSVSGTPVVEVFLLNWR